MITNDKTIFEYLKPYDNYMLSDLSKYDLDYLLMVMDGYYLEYRECLGISNENTFGIEIEFDNYDVWRGFNKENFVNQIGSIVGNENWDVVNDWSLIQGGEIVSEVLIDTKEDWDKVKNVCGFISPLADTGNYTGSHVHVGGHVLGENTNYWCRLFKLWSVYENIIYRFCYGEHFKYRPNIIKYARPAALFYTDRLRSLKTNMKDSVLEMFISMEPYLLDSNYTRRFGLSYWRMLFDDDWEKYPNFDVFTKGCTTEFRVPNGTFNEIIWQNNINLFVKMMLYCKSDRYDEDTIDKRYLLVYDNFSELASYSSIYLEQAIEFADLIFDNNLDKIYFLKQYLKDVNETEVSFKKIKRLTMSNNK